MAKISRRTLVATAAAAPLAAFLSSKSAKAAPPKPPNIVFFLADDLGYADVACYGRPDISTPNIDRIAKNGVKFLQGYANSAVCSASRTALITGRYQYRLRVGLEEPIGNGRDIGMPPEQPTLPSLLKAAGYGTTLLGKWHLGSLPKFSPLMSGYDHFWGFRGGALDYYSHSAAGPEGGDLWDGDTPIQETGYMTDLIGDRAVTAVNDYAKTGKPFLIDVHFNAPHWPWEAPGDQAESERLKNGNLGAYDAGTQATYRKMIERMDFQVGRVLQALEKKGLSDNTIVVFTSDNGGERFADTWPFTGRKTELLEGGLRVPSIVSWPARLPRGKVSNQVMIHMDWVATLLSAAGVSADPRSPLDGVDLLPNLTGKTPDFPRKLYWRFKSNAQRAHRDGDWKILKIRDNAFLFNVADDPMERANMRARQPAIFDRLAAEWNQWNTTILPELMETKSDNFTGAELADHIGAGRAGNEPDLDPAWPAPARQGPPGGGGRPGPGGGPRPAGPGGPGGPGRPPA
jgi:arylsulfatase A-like enzyme